MCLRRRKDARNAGDTEGAEGRERLKSFGMPVGCRFAPAAEFAGDFPMRSPLGNETKKRISSKVCDNGPRKESPFAKILPKSGREQGIAYENATVFPSPRSARAVIGPITKTSSQINSIITASRT